jgi:hypothetical protein
VAVAKRQTTKRGSTAHLPSISEMSTMTRYKCVHRREDAGWQVRGEPSSDHAGATAAIYSIKKLRYHVNCSLPYIRTVPFAHRILLLV